MSGYRVSVASDDPLAIDAALCQTQYWQQRLLIHALITLVSVGLWLPGLLVWLATSRDRARRFAGDYSVEVRGGLLAAGNATESRSVPLDAVADVAVRSGFVTVSIRGAQALSLFGLRDPRGAARAILAAREAHVQGMRGELREDVFGAEAGAGQAGSRHAR